MRMSKSLSFHISKLKLRLVTNETRAESSLVPCPLYMTQESRRRCYKKQEEKKRVREQSFVV